MTPLSLLAYRAATRMFGALARPALSERARRGKEDPDRLNERFARNAPARPAEKLIWFNAASVGESLMLGPVIEELLRTDPELGCLVTTQTRTSAALMGERLPERCAHQYAPIDRPDVAKRFFDHWRPELAAFVESEIWPNLIFEAHKRAIPLALINARMTEKSIKGWSRLPGAAHAVFSKFDWIGAADERSAAGLSRLAGRVVEKVGNLKQAVDPPGADEETLKRLRALIAPRPVWLAASTHPGEDEIMLDAHQRLRGETDDWLLIIAPRHPERGPEITAMAEARGFAAARRSAGAEPGRDVSVYVADTLGEMGLWYRLADATVIGGSLLPDIGGHNPLEPALLDTPMMSGPFTHNFDAIFAELSNEGGAEIVTNGLEIARGLRELTPETGAQRAAVARQVAMSGESVLKTTVMALRRLLETAAHARA